MGKIWEFIKLFGPMEPYSCPHCGHSFMIDGPPHDKALCEVMKLRKELQEGKFK